MRSLGWDREHQKRDGLRTGQNSDGKMCFGVSLHLCDTILGQTIERLFKTFEVLHMVPVAAGIIGFVAGLFADFASLKRWGYVKSLCWLAVALLLGYAHLAVGFSSDKFWLPMWTRWPGWICLLVGVFLMFYSLYLEIPAAKTYVQHTGEQTLVQVGTYALTRHPGVLWYALSLIGLIVVSRSRLALVAAPIWFGMELLWVWVEDRFIFEKVITGYGEYKTTTPMLIPSWASLTRCWKTLPLRHALIGRSKTKDRTKAD